MKALSHVSYFLTRLWHLPPLCSSGNSNEWSLSARVVKWARCVSLYTVSTMCYMVQWIINHRHECRGSAEYKACVLEGKTWQGLSAVKHFHVNSPYNWIHFHFTQQEGAVTHLLALQQSTLFVSSLVVICIITAKHFWRSDTQPQQM